MKWKGKARQMKRTADKLGNWLYLRVAARPLEATYRRGSGGKTSQGQASGLSWSLSRTKRLLQILRLHCSRQLHELSRTLGSKSPMGLSLDPSTDYRRTLQIPPPPPAKNASLNPSGPANPPPRDPCFFASCAGRQTVVIVWMDIVKGGGVTTLESATGLSDTH